MDWPYEIAERDHEIQNPTSAEKILLLGSYLRLTAESRVLDVACGKGGPAAILAAAYGCRITGVEIRPGFADAARERVVAAGLDGLVEIRTADAAGIELEPDTLDAALCLGAAFVWGSIADAAAALRPAVRPGGFVAIGEPFWRRWPLPDGVDPEGYVPLAETAGAPRGGRLRADGARRCVRGRLGPLREPALAGDGGVAGRAARRGAPRHDTYSAAPTTSARGGRCSGGRSSSGARPDSYTDPVGPSPLTSWTFDPAAFLLIAASGFLYYRRAATLANRGTPVELWRRLVFGLGLILAFLAVASPIHALGEQQFFFVHMIQHILLGDLAPLCFVAGLTGPLLRPVLALPAVMRLRFLTLPYVAFPIWAANLLLWHLPVAYQGALHHSGIHAVQHLLFFTCGALMWAPVVEVLPGPAWFGTGMKLGYIAAVRIVETVLGNIFVWSGGVFYTAYEHPVERWGISAARRPGDRRRGDDARGLAGHARRAGLALPALGTRERGAPAAARRRESIAARPPARSATAGRYPARGR